MREKFTFDIQTGDKKDKTILIKNDEESRTHIALKLLAYLYYYDPALQVEVDVGMHYKPDLVLADSEGKLRLWIDCGYVSVTKVESLVQKLKSTQIVLVKATGSELRNFKKLIERKIPDAPNLSYLSFEKNFVEQVAEAFERKTEVTSYPIGENAIGVIINEKVFETDILR